ncbi:MAG: hypothetical protein JXM70_04300 [Pirellulales bacterium]|nr:hypothetical protein [Pirellulales bacterium]
MSHLGKIMSSTILLVILLPATGYTAIVIVPDPIGDTFGSGPVQHDIVSTHVTLSATDITFEVFFNEMIAPTSSSSDGVVGYIDLDVDRSSLTGEISHVTDLGNAPSGLGIEYYVDLLSEPFHPGFVELVDANTNTTIDPALPISFSADSFSVAIPLSSLASGDGQVDFGILVGTVLESTDQSVGTVIPEASSLLIWSLLGSTILVGVVVRKVRFSFANRN